MRARITAAAVAGLVATACVGSDADPVRNQLLDAQANWERAAIEDYRIEVTQNDHEYAGCTWFAEVRGGELVESGSMADGDMACVEWLVTVPELHRAIDIRIQDLVAAEGELEVEWSGDGVPEAVTYALRDEPQESLAITTVFTDLGS